MIRTLRILRIIRINCDEFRRYAEPTECCQHLPVSTLLFRVFRPFRGSSEFSDLIPGCSIRESVLQYRIGSSGTGPRFRHRSGSPHPADPDFVEESD